MPFVIRKIEPKYLVRGHVPGTSKDWPVGAELEAVANGALTASLKQLASVLLAAEDIFAELTKELGGIAERSGNLRVRIDGLEEKLAKQDPKKVTVPESDICTFAARKEHFRTKREETSKDLFREETRPKALRELYESAASVAVRSLDSLRRDRDAISSIDMFVCTPILGKRTRERSLDIESRVPRAIEKLRRWTSAEALGDVTVSPDCTSRISVDALDDTRPVDHKLPSPEEQVQAVALKFPAEIVAVDVSGRGFHRMSMRRRSTHTGQENHQSETVKRRSRPRRPRGKRRNTIAGTDRNEIRQAVVGEPRPDDSEASPTSVSKPAHRSASTDLLGSSTKYHSVEKKSHFMTLKAWGMSRLKLIGPVGKSNQHNQQQAFSSQQVESNDRTSQINGTNETRATRTQNASDANKENCEGETMFAEGRRGRRDTGKHQTSSYPRTRVEDQREEGTRDRGDERDPGSSSRPTSVRLRESAAERRERRKAGSRQDEPPHSSSGNWSASSESGRASIGSETTSTTHPPRSTTTASIGTSSTSLSHARRFKGRDTSASSSVTSEGTLTPDIIPDSGVPPFSDDGETSSVYSCDTEGYYTSFHVDSGLKTLREEEPTQLVQSAQPSQPQFKSNEVQSEPGSPGFENEYELFGRGSTSTTTSSAGTVCTTLLAPPPPERKSSLTVAAMVHGPKQNGGESPDSGHNTSSSPVESASSPACTARSCSEFEYSESSDLEGCERIERIRTKTTIDTSRIPSMCVITPPGSDDEHRDLHSRESREQRQPRKDSNQPGSVLMSATVGTSKMQVINGQDKNLYATVQTVVQTTVSPVPSAIEKAGAGQQTKISPLSGVLGKLRGVLPGRKHQQKSNSAQESNDIQHQMDSGDYVTIADVRNNNDKRGKCGITMSDGKPTNVTYANADLFKRDAEYVSLSELPKKPDSSLERRRQGARVTLDSDGKVVFSSDSLKRRKGAHTTFIPGPFVKEGPSSPMHSPLVHRSKITPRAVQRTSSVDLVDGDTRINVPEMQNQQRQQQQQQQKQQLQRSGKLIIRATKSPERASSPEYVRGPATVVAPSAGQRHLRCGAYVNVQGGEDAALPAVQQQQQQQTPNEPRHQSSLSHEDRQVHARASRIHSEPRERHQRFYTLPGWRVTKDVVTEPPRSLTPDAAVRLGAPSHTPVGLSALGYRFLASPGRDAPRNLGGFASSTPSCAQLQLPDRLGTGPAWSGSDSGRTTPTNPHLMLSPIKSTMSNEELFAAIHKSKRRLNIRDELEGTWLPPGCPPRLPGTRHSWSPESRDTPEVPRTVPPVSTTSRMDFKRLLLQQSIKSGPARISATEQLRLSRQQCLEGQRTPPRAHQPSQTPPAIAKVLSPRSGWRFHTPRTDVLSSTIIEDAAAEEKAMKPSPELPSPATEMPLPALVNTVRRQLRLTDERTEPVIDVAMEKQEKELENRLQAMRPNEEEDPIRAIEHRRMSNQLARARFLAEAPASDPPETHGRFTTTGRFRARSESPRQKIPSTSSDATTKLSSNIVTRCPSAPALETAL